MKHFVSLIAFVLLTGLAGFIGAQFEPGSWHAALVKPSWNPPSWLFGPVWTTLYVLIAVSGWRVWQRRVEPWAGTALAFPKVKTGFSPCRKNPSSS